MTGPPATAIQENQAASTPARPAGTAWHWGDPVAGAVKAAHVLRPGGQLAPFHHVFQSPPEVMEALAKACRRVAPDSPFNLSSQLARSALDADSVRPVAKGRPRSGRTSPRPG